jgi:hypothetical protein
MMSIFSPPSSRTTLFTRAPAGADAGADRVDLRVAAGDGDLGAVARLPGECLDLDRAVGDLGDLELKQAADKLGAGAAEDDLGAAAAVLNLQQDAADALAGGVFLAGHLLLAGHDGLGLAEVDEEVVALAAADGAAHDVAHGILEIVVDALLLEGPQALHDGLAGRLGGDAPEVGRVDLLLDGVADDGTRLEYLGLLDVDL